jgi:hypothetical protein
MEGFGRLLIYLGVVLVIAGVIFLVGEKFGLGRLPGDISFRKGNFFFHFPIVTSIVLSMVITLILNLFFRK